MRETIRDRKYLDAVRDMRCIVTGRRGNPDYETVDPAHIGTAGKGMKSSDDEVIPLIHSIHRLCHEKGEISTLRELLPDDVLREAMRAYARELYQQWKTK